MIKEVKMKIRILKILALSFSIFVILAHHKVLAVTELLDALAERETGETSYSRQCSTVNRLGFTGRFQLGEALLHDLGYYKDDSGYYRPDSGHKRKNTWGGRFKNGLSSYQDLLDNVNQIQEKIIIEAFLMNKEIIEEALGTKIHKISEEYTASGIIAGAHLCGPYAVIKYFQNGASAADEFGTRLEEYMEEFSDYVTNSEELKLKKALKKIKAK